MVIVGTFEVTTEEKRLSGGGRGGGVVGDDGNVRSTQERMGIVGTTGHAWACVAPDEGRRSGDGCGGGAVGTGHVFMVASALFMACHSSSDGARASFVAGASFGLRACHSYSSTKVVTYVWSCVSMLGHGHVLPCEGMWACVGMR